MVDVLKSWLRSRLGVVIDLTDGIFGHHARDGTLLARLLHSYDIINDIQLNEITQTQDPALARVNLRHLGIWLKFVGVDCDDQCIRDVSNGKGSAAVQLFYKVFLCLEKKDRLHFITLQREREKFLPSSGKFDVTIVPEETPLKEPEDDPLSSELIWNESVIEWYREKFQGQFEDCKKQKKNFEASQHANEWKRLNVLQPKVGIQEEEIADIDKFDREHGFKNFPTKIFDSYDKSEERRDLFNGAGDPEAVQSFMRSLKTRRQKSAAVQNMKYHMQNLLLSELWESVEKEQEKKLDKILANQIIAQSQYEKQMVKKICDIRNEKIRMAENRRMIEKLMQEAREDEIRILEERWKQELSWENDEADDECERLKELYQRIEQAKLKRTREKLNQLGFEIVEDLIDISINSAEYRMANDNEIPQRIWNEWKIQFIRDSKIHETLEFQEELGDVGDGYEETFEANQSLEMTGKKISSERDFEDYHKMQMLWEEFVPEVDEDSQELLKLGSNVLGCIVHKLLEVIYPIPCESTKFPFVDFPIRAVLLGIPDPSLYNPLQEILNLNKVKIVTLEDAINYCLQKYKEEMKEFNYVNLDSFKTSNVVGQKSFPEVSQLEKRRKNDKNSGKPDGKTSFEKTHGNNSDRQTQTPKTIPYEDMHPILTDAAYVGKCIYEFLALGEPISDDLTTKILSQYLQNLKNIEGWVIINYPNTYAQMMSFENELNGQTMSNFEDVNEHTESMTEIDFLPPRITFLPGNPDPFAAVRQSRLLPNPLKKKKSSPNTILTCFIRVLAEKMDNANTDENTIDEFYVEQKVASAVQYNSCNETILKDLVRLIIGDNSPDSHSEKFNSSDKNLLEGIKSEESSPSRKFSDTTYEEFGENKKYQLKPGEVGWIWTDIQPNSEILGGIAALWVEMETRYISELTEILDMKSTNFSIILPYKDFVMKEMREFIQRPDNKQELLCEFQKAFNDIPEDMRDGEEVKCELHCRVNDFQTKLWEICDSRRKEAVEKSRNIVLDDWTAMQMISLTNIFLTILQAELDRFSDTLQVIDCYYSTIIERSPLDRFSSKILLHKLNFGDEKISENTSQTTKERNKFTTTGMISIKYPPIPDTSILELKTEISNFLLNVDEHLVDCTQSASFKTIQSNIIYIQSTIDNLYFSAVNNIQKGDTKPPKSSRELKGRKKSSKRTSLQSSKRPQLEKNRESVLNDQTLENLFAEWQSALNFESNRISLRLKLLEKAAKSDIDFLLSTMKRSFDKIRELIAQRFKNEIQSVNDLTEILCNAIEDGQSIQEELILDGDRFVMKPASLMYPENVDLSRSFVAEDSELSRFKIGQLGRLKDIFFRVAPSGKMPALSLIYILQDLIACGERGESLIPPLWLEFKPQEIPKLVRELFHDSSFICWREFLIYAMDIEMPNTDELLNVQEAFKKKDREGIGLINREDYLQVPLWFPIINTNYSFASWLHDDYEQDQEQMYEEEITLQSFHSMYSTRKSKTSDQFLPTSDQMSSEDLRLILIRELLCEMFLESNYTVNYSAMLLSFCKDEDPKQGLSKALSLATGKKLCSDFDVGERFISKIVEEKHARDETRTQRDSLRLEALEVNEEILNNLMQKVFEMCNTPKKKGTGNISMPIKNTEYRESEANQIEKLDKPDTMINRKHSFVVDSQEPSHHSLFDGQASKSPSLSQPGSSSRQIPFDLSTGTIVQPRDITYWLPFDVFQSVLSAVDSQIMDQRDINHSGKSFRENLDEIRGYLSCEELNSDRDVILAHRLIHHELVVRILNEMSKFSSRNLKAIATEIIQNGENTR